VNSSPRYLILFKPYGVISQFSDAQGGRPTLGGYVDVPRVYPVGRLDHDSEGLLLLSNDGWLQHRLTDPRYDHPKTYWVQVEGEPDDGALQHLREGIQIWPDFRTRPAAVRRLESEPALPPRDPPIRFRLSVPTAWLEIVLTEGRNRQVRRMTAAVGFPTLRLVRVAIGAIRFEGLEPGRWRDLTASELEYLQPFARGRSGSSSRKRIS
jgi:23S rRNA pseudouridine2457 synthase